MPHIVPPTDEMIAHAADTLRKGGVVAFPTETVYGLGAGTFNTHGLALVYKCKGRPKENPLIAHVQDAAQVRTVIAAFGVGGGGKSWDERCDELARRFWPGPLTLVLPKAATVPELATGGLGTIAVRSPRHLVAQRLLRELGSPISAPSANRAGRVSPTSAQHVMDEFDASLDFPILDGGPCEVGLESTVVDMTQPSPVVLRHGSVTLEQLRAILGEVIAPPLHEQGASPGTSPAHYAPRTPAELVDSDRLGNRLAELAQPVAVLCFDAGPIKGPHRALAMPQDPRAYAAALYDALRRADAMNVSRILIERPEASSGLWRAIHDRLRRATSEIPGSNLD
jgi:L-threonylcarbamoyladenylate synthase